MPSDHQGMLMRSQGDPVLYLSNPAGVTRDDRRAQLDALAAINQEQHERFADPEILSRIKQHEMAYRMQTSVPELMDLSQETEETFELYGEEARTPGTFAACCLNARRLGRTRRAQHSDLPSRLGRARAICRASTSRNAKTSTKAVRR